MRNIFIVLNKEWQDIRQQRSLLSTIIVPPVLFALLPVVLLIVVGQLPSAVTRLNSIAVLPIPTLSDLNASELAQALIALQFSLFYIILPIVIPSVIAAYSIVGEKNSHTLEPLLATPIQTWQLLVGKCLAAILPAVIVTWVCGGIFAVVLRVVAVSSRVVAAVITPGWLIALIFWTPVLSLLAVAVITAVSSRVNDPRTAQQFSAWFVVPFLLVFLGQLFGFVILGVFFALMALFVLIVVMIGTFWVATLLFQREVILTRWK